MAIIREYNGKSPKIAEDAFIAENAVIIGDVEIGSQSNVWYGCTIRGDVNPIRKGAGTNIQDNTVIHVAARNGPVNIGNGVTIGHAALLHGTVRALRTSRSRRGRSTIHASSLATRWDRFLVSRFQGLRGEIGPAPPSFANFARSCSIAAAPREAKAKKRARAGKAEAVPQTRQLAVDTRRGGAHTQASPSIEALHESPAHCRHCRRGRCKVQVRLLAAVVRCKLPEGC